MSTNREFRSSEKGTTVPGLSFLMALVVLGTVEAQTVVGVHSFMSFARVSFALGGGSDETRKTFDHYNQQYGGMP